MSSALKNSASVVVSVIQTQPVFGDVLGNLNRIKVQLDEAASKGSKLVILPELCTTGYMFETKIEAYELAEDLNSSSSIAMLTQWCQELDLEIVLGIAEKVGDKLFNSAALVTAEGLRGTYRKLHLWENENKFFEPGDLGVPVFDTKFGKLAILICYDLWFPEAVRSAVLQGADALCIPTNWVPIPGQDVTKTAMAVTLCQSMAHVNGVHIFAADRVGIERGQKFIGQSAIVKPSGWPAEGPAPEDVEAILTSTVDFSAGRRSRKWNAFNNPLADRRPMVYRDYLEIESL
jgi:N-carbamoylputrescine amidase